MWSCHSSSKRDSGGETAENISLPAAPSNLFLAKWGCCGHLPLSLCTAPSPSRCCDKFPASSTASNLKTAWLCPLAECGGVDCGQRKDIIIIIIITAHRTNSSKSSSSPTFSGGKMLRLKKTCPHSFRKNCFHLKFILCSVHLYKTVLYIYTRCS